MTDHLQCQTYLLGTLPTWVVFTIVYSAGILTGYLRGRR